jgi:DNA-binding response OmpR family regulator
MIIVPTPEEGSPRLPGSCGGNNCALDADETHRILVVDDDESLRDLMVETLKPERYEVDVASTCQDALPLILFRDYCGILLDIILPDANGMSLFRQIARRRPEMRPRVIFITGAMGQDEADRISKLMRNRVLLKPFRIEELIAAIHQVDNRVLR